LRHGDSRPVYSTCPFIAPGGFTGTVTQHRQVGPTQLVSYTPAGLYTGRLVDQLAGV